MSRLIGGRCCKDLGTTKMIREPHLHSSTRKSTYKRRQDTGVKVPPFGRAPGAEHMVRAKSLGDIAGLTA
jgi:hypothetical protein